MTNKIAQLLKSSVTLDLHAEIIEDVASRRMVADVYVTVNGAKQHCSRVPVTCVTSGLFNLDPRPTSTPAFKKRKKTCKPKR